MKLLFCPHCYDVVAPRMKRWRRCACGRCGIQYNADSLTATVGGEGARIFGVANPFFDPDFEKWTPQKKGSVHRRWGYGPNEIWWGGHVGDWQLHVIQSPAGPRLSHRTVLSRIRKMLRELGKEEAEITAVIKSVNTRKAEFEKARNWKKFRTKK